MGLLGGDEQTQSPGRPARSDLENNQRGFLCSNARRTVREAGQAGKPDLRANNVTPQGQKNRPPWQDRPWRRNR